MANARSSDELPGSLLPPCDGQFSDSALAMMEAGVATFAERGYHGASVRDLCAAVGIKAGSFYSLFASKELLLFEILRLAYESHWRTLQGAVVDAGAEPGEQLRQFTRAAVRFHGEYPLLTIVANSELHALGVANRARIFSLRRKSTALGVTLLQRGSDAGAFDCPEPWMAMSAIGGMMIRVSWWFRGPNSFDPESPLSSYPDAVRRWMPAGGYTVDEVADAYASYALQIARGNHD